MSDEELEPAAERIAAQGHDALVERLRLAFRQAADAHADLITIGDERLEELVARSVETADGLQWRRALAEVAVGELGVELPEALTHPAVARAQELAGAPSYEDTLQELTGRAVRPARVSAIPEEAPIGEEPGVANEPIIAEEPLFAEEPPVAEEPLFAEEPPVAEEPLFAEEPWAEDDVATTPEAFDEAPEEADATTALDSDETLAGLDESAEPAEGSDGMTEETMVAEPGEAPPLTDEVPATDEESAVSEEDGETLRVSAVHLGGVANLPAGREGIDLRLSEAGLDILRENDDIIGRLEWSDIETLEVPSPRGRRRRRGGRGVLVIRTEGGDASFEIPPMSPDELRERIDPIVARFGSV